MMNIFMSICNVPNYIPVNKLTIQTLLTYGWTELPCLTSVTEQLLTKFTNLFYILLLVCQTFLYTVSLWCWGIFNRQSFMIT